MHITTTVDIEAPIDVVWPLLNEDENLNLWMPDVIETSYPDGKQAGDPVGTRFIQKIREGGGIKTYDGQVTAYEPRQLLGVRLGDDSNFQTDVTYRLSEDGAGTRLDYDCEITLKSWFGRIMSVIGVPMARQIVRRHMANLKRVAEERAMP